MAGNPQLAYRFGVFCVLARDRQLLREGAPVPLAPKVFDTLLVLLERQGRLVEKDEFLKRVWHDSFVEEVALAHSISQLRKVLRDRTGEPRFIETVSKRGYRFVAPVDKTEPVSAEASPAVTLAVLPFENLGAGAEREYLADGLTEEVIAALGQAGLDRFGVIGRTSMMAYKGTTKSLAEIGRELGAAFLVESSIRAEGGRLRVTSKLIRARDQVQTWSASYDSEPASLLEFQRELSTVIAQQVRLRLTPQRLDTLAERQTAHPEAYDLYLRGRYLWNQLAPPTTRRALEQYTRATQLDPDYALAWSGLADAYATSPIHADIPSLQVWRPAREAAAHAVGAGPNLAEAQTSLGFVKFWLDWEWAAAESAFRKAIEFDPSYALAHRMLGLVLSQSGWHADAQPAVRRACELDPLDFVHQALSAQVAFNCHDVPAAVELAQRAIVLNPEFWIGHLQLAQAYEQLGRCDLAFEALDKAGPASGGNSKVLALRGYMLARAGRTGEAREVLNALEARSRERYVPPYATALIYAGLGQRDLALHWLERAYNEHDVHLAFLLVDPKWDEFRTDAGFCGLIERCAFTAGQTGRGSSPQGA